MIHSLRNRLVLVFFAVTLVAIAALYLYVAPGLQNRLVDAKLSALSRAAGGDSGQIRAALTTATPRELQVLVDQAALRSGNRVSLLGVGSVDGQPQISSLVDSPGGQGLAFPLAYRAVQIRQARQRNRAVGNDRRGRLSGAAPRARVGDRLLLRCL